LQKTKRHQRYNLPSKQIEYGTRERLCTLHEKLALFYRRYLLENPDGSVATYFRTRGIPNDAADKFCIGASPDSWDAAIQFAHNEGFIDDELRASGIVSSKDENQSHIYDRFRNRLMFPIWNESGRIVGFSARSVEAKPQGWKYVNTPDSPIFHKGRLLYALNFARTSISKAGSVVLCEGQLDAIAMHRAGITHAVAPQGTAFTPDQATILKRYTSTVVLATDNDNAGREAVFKDAAILLPLGFNVKVVRYPSAKDADETLSKFGKAALTGAVENATDFFEFALEQAMSRIDPSTPAGQAAAANEIIRWIIQIENEEERKNYFDWLANKLNIRVSSIEKVAERFLSKISNVPQRNRPKRQMKTSEDLGKIDKLKNTPELANTPGYEIEKMLKSVDPVYWFQLLIEKPQFAPPHEWWFDLRSRTDLPWARLLTAQPQFEENCHWESVGRGELVKLAFLAPKLFARKFPHGHWHDLYAFLTPTELAGVLCDVPQAAELLDMEDVAQKLAPDRWLTVIASQPQLEKYFDWTLVEKKKSLYWDELLRHQPQFACHCDFEKLQDWQIRRIRRRQPQLLPSLTTRE